MEDQILTTILKDTHTTLSLRKRVRLLKYSLERRFFGDNKPFDEFIEKIDQDWLSSFDPTLISQFNADNLSVIFGKLEDMINQIDKMVFYLPFEFPSDEISKICNYLRINNGQRLVLEVKYNPMLLAGCAIAWHGQYKEYSLRQKIRENKDIIIGEIRKMLQK